ncbi:MAG: carbohydrate ABC transporter substrate-binding protein [Clostridia bacterium]|nr:carbohydrate ABC transporter substrate-binding protein [Clostridia bacterium]
MKKRRIATLALSTVMAFGVAASAASCGGGSSASVVTLVTIYNEPIFALAARLYMEEHPDKTIITQPIPYDGAADTLKTQLIAEVAPEIMLVEEPDDFANLGLLLDFNNYIKGENSYADTKNWSTVFEDGYIDLAKDSNNRLNWVPFSLYGIGVYTNLSQYKAAGVEETPETLTEFLAAGEKLKTKGYTPWGVSIGYNDAQILWPLEMMSQAFFRSLIPEINLLHADGWTFDPNDPTCIYGEKISPEEQYLAFKKGLIDPVKSERVRSMYEIMLKMKPLWNDDFVSKDGNMMYTDFPNGEHTHFMNGTWYLPQLTGIFNDLKKGGNEDKVFEYDIIPFPKATSEDTQFLDAGAMNDIVKIRNGFIVPNYLSKAKTELAVDFIKFMSSPEVAQKMFALKNDLTGYPYCGDISLLKGVEGMEEAAKLKPDIKYADLVSYEMYYDAQDKDLFIIDYEKLLTGKYTMNQFLKARSESNLAALERNLRLYASMIDRKWLDEELKKL